MRSLTRINSEAFKQGKNIATSPAFLFILFMVLQIMHKRQQRADVACYLPELTRFQWRSKNPT